MLFLLSRRKIETNKNLIYRFKSNTTKNSFSESLKISEDQYMLTFGEN